MFTVALIGPDGAGKTTVARKLEKSLSMPVKYLYMGVNLDASNHMLFSTRLVHLIKRARGAKPDTGGPRDPNRIKSPPTGGIRRAASELKSSLRLANRIAEEWFRQTLAWYYQRRGYVVLFDRHFFSDYYAYDIARENRERPMDRRIHGFLLERVYPKPDLVILLDAPAEVLFARKHEGTIALLERRRLEYMQLRDVVAHFAVVDAAQPEDAVVRQVNELICDFYQSKFGRTKKPWRAASVTTHDN